MKPDLPVVHIWDVHEGKIASFRQFVGGARPAPPRKPAAGRSYERRSTRPFQSQ